MVQFDGSNPLSPAKKGSTPINGATQSYFQLFASINARNSFSRFNCSAHAKDAPILISSRLTNKFYF